MRFLLAVILLAFSVPAFGADKYSYPDLGAYYASLMQPDNPHVSCCGDGDAYYADRVEQCTLLDGPACAVVAIITDMRGNAIKRSDGSTIHRIPVAPGTRVPIPRNKIRKFPIPNPTEHSIVFMNSVRGVMCWEPQGGV